MLLITFALTAAMLTPRTAPTIPQVSGHCLHDTNTETQEQHARRVRALGFARTVNSAEAAYAAKSGQVYADIGQLVVYDYVKQAPASGQWVEGFDLPTRYFGQGVLVRGR